MSKKLILLDRDGVLNRHCVHPEQGTIDSPLHPSQVEMYEGAAEAAAQLTKMGYMLAIVTNQPAATQGKTTKENLQAIHDVVVGKLENAGARIAGSYICFHRKEEKCDCRKPKPALLEKALKDIGADPEKSWMVGDALTDVQAGKAANIKTAYLGPTKKEHIRVFEEHEVSLPDLWCSSLSDFVSKLKEE